MEGKPPTWKVVTEADGTEHVMFQGQKIPEVRKVAFEVFKGVPTLLLEIIPVDIEFERHQAGSVVAAGAWDASGVAEEKVRKSVRDGLEAHRALLRDTNHRPEY